MRYFKIRPPEDFAFRYEIALRDYTDKHIIGKHKLDVRNNDDALTLYLISRFDDSSIIEFYGEQFMVKDWHIDYINRIIDIYI